MTTSMPAASRVRATSLCRIPCCIQTSTGLTSSIASSSAGMCSDRRKMFTMSIGPAAAVAAPHRMTTPSAATLVSLGRTYLELFRRNPALARDVVIALDETGKMLSSAAFAQLIGKLRDEGAKTAALLIGGADGLAPEVRDKARITKR